MRSWKRRLLFVAATGFAILCLILVVGIAYLLAPVRVPDLDPQTVLKVEIPEPMLEAAGPLRDQANIDLVESFRKALAEYRRRAKDSKDNNWVSFLESRDHAVGFLEEILKAKERDGRDNAMVYYALAACLVPPPSSDGPTTPNVVSVLENGWHSPECDKLIPYIESFGPAFDKARQGAALDYSQGLGLSNGLDTPMPSFIALRLIARTLGAEGLYRESRGRYSEALDDYLTALVMGRDHTSPGNLYINHMIGVAIAKIGAKRLDSLVCSGCLSEDDLRRARDRAYRIETAWGDMADSLAFDYTKGILASRRILEFRKGWTRYAFQDPDAREIGIGDLAASPFDRRRWNDLVRQVGFRIRAGMNTDRVGPDFESVLALERNYLAEPWSGDPDSIYEELEKKIASSHILVQIMSPGVMNAKRQEAVLISSLRQCRIAAALQMWKARHGEYPASLHVLVGPEYLADGIPADPFTGKPFPYRRSAAGDSFDLWVCDYEKKGDWVSSLNGLSAP